MNTALLAKHPLFCFGTLRDSDVFQVVSGGLTLDEVGRQAARLPDHRVVSAIDGPHPVLQPAKGDNAAGLLFHDLPQDVLGRIAWFEWPEFQVETQTIEADDGWQTAACFMPARSRPASSAPWSLDAWRRQEKPELLAYAELMMAFRRVCTARDLDHYWDDILARLKGQSVDLPTHLENGCRRLLECPGPNLAAFIR